MRDIKEASHQRREAGEWIELLVFFSGFKERKDAPHLPIDSGFSEAIHTLTNSLLRVIAYLKLNTLLEKVIGISAEIETDTQPLPPIRFLGVLIALRGSSWHRLSSLQCIVNGKGCRGSKINGFILRPDGADTQFLPIFQHFQHSRGITALIAHAANALAILQTFDNCLNVCRHILHCWFLSVKTFICSSTDILTDKRTEVKPFLTNISYLEKLIERLKQTSIHLF